MKKDILIIDLFILDLREKKREGKTNLLDIHLNRIY